MTDPDLTEGISNESDQQSPSAAVSPIDLLLHLSDMTVVLERTWSAGLETETFATTRLEAKEIWSAFTNEHLRRMDWIGSIETHPQLRNLQIGFPLSNADMAKLTNSPDSEEDNFQQLALASILAFDSLLRSLTWMDNPTKIQLYATPDGVTAETWWDSGAFSTIQRRAKTMARVLTEQEGSLQELARLHHDFPELPNPSIVPLTGWQDRFDAAADLINLGYFDAALPILLQSLRLLIATFVDIPEPQLPSPISTALAKVPALSGLSDASTLLEMTAAHIGQGHSLTFGVSVPAAVELQRRLSTAISTPYPDEAWEALNDVICQ